MALLVRSLHPPPGEDMFSVTADDDEGRSVTQQSAACGIKRTAEP
jgi:hypothetical protein